MKHIFILMTVLAISFVSQSQEAKRFRVFSAKAVYYDYRNEEWVEDTTQLFHSKQKVILSIEGNQLIFSYGDKTVYTLNDISENDRWDNKSWQLWRNATDNHGNPVSVFCFQNYVQNEFYIRIRDYDNDTGLKFDVLPL